MIVTFVSQCQKKSLAITRQVLDAYANRIGDNTWQTVITQEGLNAVRSRLAKTARKTTAVSCHRIRGTHLTELVWIVGNRRQFDALGNVPVNRTQRDLLKEELENDWDYLPLIKVLTALAALFHDFGKSWDRFQTMLVNPKKRDPVRHEWISLLLFKAFVACKTDEQWLTELTDLKTRNPTQRKSVIKALLAEATPRKIADESPFDEGMSVLATWVAWLIVTHHNLPGIQRDGDEKAKDRVKSLFGSACRAEQVDKQAILGSITPAWGYIKEYRELNDKDWKFSKQLPMLSDPWCKDVARWAGKARELLHLVDSAVSVERLILTLSRLSLMLGDHHYSAQKEINTNWHSALELHANTAVDGEGNRFLKQKLDEHLVHVREAATNIGCLLPVFEKKLPKAQDIGALRKPAKGNFIWQNKAVQTIKQWRKENDLSQHGFFAINMASTGCGKTFANAKVMSALSDDASLRYNLALGLLTLTLQTGDEYRDKLGLDDTELAVLIGSAAVRYLHEQRQAEKSRFDFDADTESPGSASARSLFEGDALIYEVEPLFGNKLDTALRDRKAKQLLYAPVVVSTIDHLMPATEGVAGGRHILPTLRLMSADLVIDEVDDFDQQDLPAIGRLVHLAGMLGRKVMISSATIPPAIAEGLFHAYQAGWQLFALSRRRKPAVSVFWLDEFGNALHSVADDATFQQAHAAFISKRLKNLYGENPKRKASILPLNRDAVAEDEESRQGFWFEQVLQAALGLHRHHAIRDADTGKQLSVGVIRVANVDPCIQLAQYLLQCALPDDVDIRVMPYHARQVLLLRSEQEKHLDTVLNRKNGKQPQDDLLIKRHLQQSDKPHVIFILVATPVEEVGRDHDLDWAVIEPSSLRSIIQMAGRVMRHRVVSDLPAPNLVLPEYNRKGFVGQDKYVFHHPGYESREYPLHSHSLKNLLEVEALAERVDAALRIQCAAELQPTIRLVDLEHHVLQQILVRESFHPGTLKGWVHSAYYLTQLSQQVSRFRDSEQDEAYKLHITEEGELEMRFADQEQGKEIMNVKIESLPESSRKRLWLSLDYSALIEEQSRKLDYSTSRTCEFLGEVRLKDKQGAQHFTFIPELGFKKRLSRR